jgi:hypothetical protein
MKPDGKSLAGQFQGNGAAQAVRRARDHGQGSFGLR